MVGVPHPDMWHPLGAKVRFGMNNNSPSDAEFPVSADFHFAVIPEWVLALPVSANAIRVYCCLRRFADNSTGECFPSRRLLAMRARVSVSTLDRAIKELAEHRAISISHRKSQSGDYTSNLYVVHSFPKGVVAKSVPPRIRSGGTGGVTGDDLTKTKRTKSNNRLSAREQYEQQWITQGANFARLGWAYSRVVEEYGSSDKFSLIQQGFLLVADSESIDIPPFEGAPKQEAE